LLWSPCQLQLYAASASRVSSALHNLSNMLKHRRSPKMFYCPFAPVLSACDVIGEWMENASHKCIVGGFGASEWTYSRVLTTHIFIIRPLNLLVRYEPGPTHNVVHSRLCTTRRGICCLWSNCQGPFAPCKSSFYGFISSEAERASKRALGVIIRHSLLFSTSLEWRVVVQQ
jgi:hypothetical protein